MLSKVTTHSLSSALTKKPARSRFPALLHPAAARPVRCARTLRLASNYVTILLTARSGLLAHSRSPTRSHPTGTLPYDGSLVAHERDSQSPEHVAAHPTQRPIATAARSFDSALAHIPAHRVGLVPARRSQWSHHPPGAIKPSTR